MQDRPTASRRSVLAGAGAAAVAAVAGCQGDGDSEGENGTDETEDGGDATADGDGSQTETANPQPRGERVLSETISDDREIEYDLEQGETITVVIEPVEYGASGEIRQLERTEHLADAIAEPELPETIQYTAEQSATYVVDISLLDSDGQGETDIEVYIESS